MRETFIDASESYKHDGGQETQSLQTFRGPLIDALIMSVSIEVMGKSYERLRRSCSVFIPELWNVQEYSSIYCAYKAPTV